jgi:bifunctional non-homologous end joining protein LigD
MPGGLREYHRKRNFTRTKEPRGALRKWRGNLFVVQKHAARRLHYDLRLELDGVLKSWAITKGPSLNPADKRLAVQVEDHPLEYAEFEGRIPEGEYGAGSVIVWDRGRWSTDGDPHRQLAKGHLEFELKGTKLKGRWHLVRMQGQKKDTKENWLLIKARDEYARADGAGLLGAHPRSVKTGRTVEQVAKSKVREKPKRPSAVPAPAEANKPTRHRAASKPAGAKSGSLPAFIEPALATLCETPPTASKWVHELKFDGYRLLARIDRGRVRLLTRSGLDWTAKFASLRSALERLPVVTALLDGEVVVENEAGIPDFSSLQAELSSGRGDRFRYYLFDLLHLDGLDLMGAKLLDRKAELRQLLSGSDGTTLRYSEHFTERGDVVLKHACRLSLEGIVSKLANAPYRPGRSRTWLKAKCSDRSEFLIVGYVPSTTQRRAVGSLVLGYYRNGELVYAGRVGSGFTSSLAESLWSKLEELRLENPPFSKPLPAEARRNVRWAKPSLVAEVEFRGWTTDGIIRHSVFKGLRQDKRPAEIVREKAVSRSPARRAELPVSLTHPDRVLWPEAGVTKQGLAEFYAEIWPWIAPHVIDRPLALVRCPESVDAGCFYQKHAWSGISESVIRARDPTDDEEILAIKDLKGLLSLVQASVLEIHVWGAKLDDIDRPDGMTFDIDPGEGVPWSDVVAAACEVRDRLKAHKLASFVKTTGGKGLHVYAPLKPQAGWDSVKAFAQGIANAMAADNARRYVATMSKRQRRGRIFIDYLRNGRGATAVAAYSTRARPAATVSAPLAWDELGPEMRSDRFTVLNLIQRLSHLDDPWKDIRRSARRLPS